MNLFFKIYSLLWSLAIPLLKKNKRLHIGFAERNGETLSTEASCDVLLYAASGGEALLACQLISKLPAHLGICCFSWTEEGVLCLKKFAKAQKRDVRVFFTPFDKPENTLKILKIFSPHIVLILETEIWFGFMYACKKLNIPFYFVNGRMSEKTYKGLKSIRGILKKIAPTGVYALSQEYADRFKMLFSTSEKELFVAVMKNIKFDTALNLLHKNRELFSDMSQQSQLSPLFHQGGQSALPTLLFASVREEEEKQILMVVEKIRANFKDICIYIAPKHLNRIEFWKSHLSEYTCYSQAILNSQSSLFSLCLVDTFGHLSLLYTQCDIAFVGGSLQPLGGQNFLEALSAGIVPYTGEYLDNFDWALQVQPLLTELGLLHQVKDEEVLYSAFVHELTANSKVDFLQKKQKIREKFHAWLLVQGGGTDFLVQELFNSA